MSKDRFHGHSVPQTRTVLKEEELAGLVERSRGGDEGAWRALWLAPAK